MVKITLTPAWCDIVSHTPLTKMILRQLDLKSTSVLGSTSSLAYAKNSVTPYRRKCNLINESAYTYLSDANLINPVRSSSNLGSCMQGKHVADLLLHEI